MMALKPIKRKRLFEEIIVAVEQFIQDENIQPGMRLPSENELAAIFNVSKTAVREAMTVLTSNGVVETRAGSGIYLKDMQGESIVLHVTYNLMQKNELQDILEFRRGLEVEAAGLAAMRGTDEDLLKIKTAHDELVAANQASSVGIDEDYQFHYHIMKASHNSIYQQVFKSVSTKLKEGIRISKMQSLKLPAGFLPGYREHEEIISALFARAPEAASSAMRHHLTRNEKKIWNTFNRNLTV
ncbi:FadR/GntR family transcriptional regulator [Paenibacillus xerothermodurans]|uniref:FadR family transcriptional regulator n=1 Tax=Paenibacillus xerothermodurans TaxID=1977292 RepID=A0A2W1NCC5_PAEXE|nr:FadR/GntR family transcriptional regulator [Paenibacillus xerothermodurans]PZE22127.1 FadR family transcriptional regulator [Paenibacillus xerothermodurans]